MRGEGELRLSVKARISAICWQRAELHQIAEPEPDLGTWAIRSVLLLLLLLLLFSSPAYRKCPWTGFFSIGWLSNILFYNTSISKIDIDLLIHSSPWAWSMGGGRFSAPCLPMGKLGPWGDAPACCSLGKHTPLASASLSSGVGVGMCMHVHMLCFGLFHCNRWSLFLYTLLNGGNRRQGLAQTS